MALLCGSALAQGVPGTSKAFSTSAFCRSYRWTSLDNKDGPGHATTPRGDTTRFGDVVLVAHASPGPASKVISMALPVRQADLRHLSEDA
ncbi:hypothetical protein [Deinococcus hopiensis]|uniref:Uncharacterized protein n=1 Tax=Deinococcus hopiensis KR-140 TaxID=695939 RepID=A0A1W1VUU0_9DEIO|nr:hypothetical protein [Deinococcus hopiensis]SMB97033.1 hypothetical protein SAMN00790413_06304 [Deinococcus hopiensis KR-140]